MVYGMVYGMMIWYGMVWYDMWYGGDMKYEVWVWWIWCSMVWVMVLIDNEYMHSVMYVLYSVLSYPTVIVLYCICNHSVLVIVSYHIILYCTVLYSIKNLA